jgi:transposase-like protein
LTHGRRTELGFDPDGLREKYCPVCGELRPVRAQRDADGTKRYFCAKCQASLGEEAADSFDTPERSFPDA